MFYLASKAECQKIWNGMEVGFSNIIHWKNPYNLLLYDEYLNFTEWTTIKNTIKKLLT